MEYLTDIDEYAAALKQVDFSIDLNMKDSSGFLMESNQMDCYRKAQKILDVPEMIKCHKRCLDVNYDNVTESDIQTINELYDLGVERGFIDPEMPEETPEDVCPNCGEYPCVCHGVGDVKDIGDGSEMYDVDAELYESSFDVDPDDEELGSFADFAELDSVSEDEPENIQEPEDENFGNNDLNDAKSAEYDPEFEKRFDQVDNSESKPEDMPFEGEDETQDQSATSDGGEPVQDADPEPAEQTDEQPAQEPTEEPEQETAEQPTEEPAEEPADDQTTEPEQTEEPQDAEQQTSEEPEQDASQNDADTQDDATPEQSDDSTENSSDEESSEDSEETTDDTEGEDDKEDTEGDAADTSTEEKTDDGDQELTAEQKKERKDQYVELWRKTLKDLSIPTPISDVTDPSKKSEFWDKISSGWDKEDPADFMTAKDLEKLETSEKVDDVESDETDDSNEESDKSEDTNTETADDKEDTSAEEKSDDSNEESEEKEDK